MKKKEISDYWKTFDFKSYFLLGIAYENVCSAFINFANDNGIDDNEKKRIQDLFSDVYNEKKAEIFLGNKLNECSNWFGAAFTSAIAWLSIKHPDILKKKSKD